MLHFVNFSQNNYTLPFFQDGIWKIYHSDGKIIDLSQTIHYVNMFDEFGFSNYEGFEEYGIINQKGEKIFISNQKIVQLGGGKYVYMADNKTAVLELFKTKEQEEVIQKINQIKNFKNVSVNWYSYEKGDSIYFNNKYSADKISLVNNADNFKVMYEMLLIKNANYSLLYNEKGIKIDSSIAYVQNDGNYFFYKGKNQHFLKTKNFHLNLSDGDNFYFKDNYFVLKKEGVCQIRNLENKVLFDYKCDSLIKLDQNYYLINIKNKVGLIDKAKKTRIPVKYDNIIKSVNGFIVEQKELIGFVDENFNLRIPCEFKLIEFKNDFIHTSNFLDKKGLIHSTSFNEILPAIYDLIEIQENQIFAYTDKTLTLVILDEAKNVIKKSYFENFVKIRDLPINEPSIDQRLLSIGWYYEKNIIDEFNIRYKWGLKDSNDSIIKKPVHYSPIYVPNAFFSMINVHRGSDPYLNFKTFNDERFYNYRLIDYRTGKVVKVPDIHYLDTNDFKNYNYARFRSKDGMGYILNDKTVVNLQYIDLYDDEYNRVCNAKDIKFLGEESNSLFKINTNNCYPDLFKFSNKSYIEFVDAEWNFIDQNGDNLFDVNFDFTEKFEKGTAIAKQKTGWGILTPEQIIVPFQYSSINRLKEFNDTVFLVSINDKRDLFLDSNLNEVHLNGLKHIKRRDDFTAFKNQDSNLILDESNEVIMQSDKYYKSLNDNYLFTRKASEFEIYDKQGALKTSSEDKPNAVYFNNYFSIYKNRNFYFLNFYGDTFSLPEFKVFNDFGNCLVIQGEKFKYLYNRDFDCVNQFKNENIFTDSFNMNYILESNKSYRLFNLNNKDCQMKIRTESPIIKMTNNVILFKDETLTYVDGEKINIKYKVIDIVCYEKSRYCVFDDQKRWHVFDASWVELTDSNFQNNKLNYHGKGIYSSSHKGKKVLYSFDYNLKIDGFDQIEGNANEGMLSVQKNNKSLFLDIKADNVFKHNFHEVKPFNSGIGLVKYYDGWTMIDLNGKLKSYPSYNELIYINKNLYKTTKKTLYGLVDSNGNYILDVKYEKIKINKNIIQTISHGEIHYYDLSGNLIF